MPVVRTAQPAAKYMKFKAYIVLASLLAASGLLSPTRALAIQATLLDDAYTSSDNPGSTFGAQPRIQLSPARTGYIQFDVSTLPDGTHPQDVAKANLTMYVTAGSVKVPGSFALRAVAGPWDELSITKTTAPAFGATVVSGI